MEIEWVHVLRFAHIIGAAVLFGTGAGIAFFMVMAHRTHEARPIAQTASTVVIADWIFTATAVVLQPITGILLAKETGWHLTESWIIASIGLYVLVGLFWLPVVWIQKTMRDIALNACKTGTSLTPHYYKLYRIWFVCGFPAFFAVIAIYVLMIVRPTLW